MAGKDRLNRAKEIPQKVQKRIIVLVKTTMVKATKAISQETNREDLGKERRHPVGLGRVKEDNRVLFPYAANGKRACSRVFLREQALCIMQVYDLLSVVVGAGSVVASVTVSFTSLISSVILLA